MRATHDPVDAQSSNHQSRFSGGRFAYAVPDWACSREDRRDRAALRKFFPQQGFSTGGLAGFFSAVARTFTGTGAVAAPSGRCLAADSFGHALACGEPGLSLALFLEPWAAVQRLRSHRTGSRLRCCGRLVQLIANFDGCTFGVLRCRASHQNRGHSQQHRVRECSANRIVSRLDSAYLRAG